ncbi:MAG: hypothetical protein IJS52_03915 [Bacilli bacterium]|nr:hypothetical protein [Bacilli bacterium]
MNVHEERMCELQAEVFERSATCFPCTSSLFASRFMRSKTAKKLDDSKDAYNYCSSDEALFELAQDYPSLKESKGEKLPVFILRWMGYIYRAFSILKSASSLEIYKRLKPEKLCGLYESFHTFDPDYCVERLAEILGWGGHGGLSDYQIYRQVRLSLRNKTNP